MKEDVVDGSQEILSGFDLSFVGFYQEKDSPSIYEDAEEGERVADLVDFSNLEDLLKRNDFEALLALSFLGGRLLDENKHSEADVLLRVVDKKIGGVDFYRKDNLKLINIVHQLGVNNHCLQKKLSLIDEFLGIDDCKNKVSNKNYSVFLMEAFVVY
ncbi:MAG: hypothetical protein OEL89_03140, partial [Candidatus Peregrinibacteria bacterium]|nr:hypothetical protein [Candidatus Peregrinibacteria bacterium]